MSRRMSSLALALALLTGIVLGGVFEFFEQSASPAIVSSSTEATRAVRVFYDNLNRYLATGDESFHTLLAPEYQDYLPEDTHPGSLETLQARLDLLRTSAVPPEYSIESLQDLGSVVEVHVSFGMPGTLEVAGLAVTLEATPAIVELVQVRRGVIVARWSHDDLIPRIDRSTEDLVSLSSSSLLTAEIDHLTIDRAGELHLAKGVPFALLVEAGDVTLTMGTTEEVLRAGENRWIAADERAYLKNRGSSPVALWLVPIGAVSIPPGGFYGESAATIYHDAGLQRIVWSSQLIDTSPVMLHLHVEEVVLPPGAEFSSHHALLGESIAVLDGALQVTIREGAAQFCSSGTATVIQNDAVTLTAGEGIAPDLDTTLMYRVTGQTPATLLVLTTVAGPVIDIG